MNSITLVVLLFNFDHSSKNNMDIKLYKIKVTGKVQGVWFRKDTARRAKDLGILGFVRNETDNSVYIEVVGAEKALEIFLDWLHIGSPMSKVRSVNFEVGEMKDFTTFDVLS